MQELINVSAVPAKLAVNFDELRRHLEKELERYAVVVTADTLADAKKLATELNKTAGLIDKRRKEEVASVSEPIKAFDGQMRELVMMCQDGRKKILDQVKRFEDETKAQAESLLRDRRAALWDSHGVEEEFRRAGYDDLILLTSITAKGSLARAAADKLESRVRDDKSLQDRTRMRLLELENQSFKAGLAAPLTRDHVNPFLFADDAHYAAELQRILAAEVARQEEAERRLRERIEREQHQAEEKQRAEDARLQREAQEAVRNAEARQEMEEAVAQQSAQRQAQSPADWEDDETPFEDEADRKIDYVVTATFETSVSADVGVAQIEAELRRVMKAAGIRTLASVHIARKRGVPA